MRARLDALGPWLVSLFALSVSACSPASQGSGADGAGPGDGDGSGDAGTDGSGGRDVRIEDPDPTSCTGAGSCEGDGVCVGGVCCAAELACGDACCASGSICSFQKCEKPGAECTDSNDCSQGEYCEYSLGDDKPPSSSGDAGVCTGGAVVLTGKCLPRPPVCPEGFEEPSDGTLSCLHECEVRPQVAEFKPTVKYAWGGATAAPFFSDVMMTPIVIQLDDDDCDGKISARDIPEIVFSTFEDSAYTAAGVLRAISIIGGEVVEKWDVPGIVNPTKHLAGGNIDGKPGNEVVACGVDGKVYAFIGESGEVLWDSGQTRNCFMPQLADLDQDGRPEVIVEGGILDGATGELLHPFAEELSSAFVVSDIDGDGKLDIVTATQGFRGDGSLIVDTKHVPVGDFHYVASDWKGPWPAVADFDGDGKPEIVVVDNWNHELSIWCHDGSQPGGFEIVRQPIDINAKFASNHCSGWGKDHGGGPPTIADFNGDGTPDVALAGGIGYVVFDGKKLMDGGILGPETILWAKPTTDCSSASTGSTVFDFNGDGKAEVVYSDEKTLRIYEGATGEVLFSTCNTTATLIENPIVADVDNDGHADIIVVSNAYGGRRCDLEEGEEEAKIGPSGIRIFGDEQGAWVRTRRVWNQHSYHVTNVEEDGTIPAVEASNWKQPGLNNFRQNKQPGAEFAAPDAVVSVAPRCTGEYGLVATVRNVGQAALPAGAKVRLFAGNPPGGVALGELATTRALYPAEAESLFLAMPDPDPAITSGATLVYAIVEEPLSARECRADNNVSQAAEARCKTPM